MARDLVERAIAGDHDAFGELARTSIQRLYVIARLILHDDGSAEDATQEALVDAWRGLGGLRDPDRFDAWLHRLLVHACYREARRHGRRRTLELSVRPLQIAEPADGSRLDLDFANRDELERGFRRLVPDHRAVLVLHYYLGHSLDETADLLGVPPGTVRSRLTRANALMRAALEADARTPQLEEGRPA